MLLRSGEFGPTSNSNSCISTSLRMSQRLAYKLSCINGQERHVILFGCKTNIEMGRNSLKKNVGSITEQK